MSNSQDLQTLISLIEYYAFLDFFPVVITTKGANGGHPDQPKSQTGKI